MNGKTKIIYGIDWFYNLIKWELYKEDCGMEAKYMTNADVEEWHIEELPYDEEMVEENIELFTRVIKQGLSSWFLPQEFFEWMNSVKWEKVEEYLDEHGSEDYKARKQAINLWLHKVNAPTNVLDLFKRE